MPSTSSCAHAQAWNLSSLLQLISNQVAFYLCRVTGTCGGGMTVACIFSKYVPLCISGFLERCFIKFQQKRNYCCGNMY